MKLETVELDLAPLVSAFGRRLHEAGVPVTPERSARLAAALTLTRPVARTRLYWTARAVLVSDQAQVGAFDREFFSVFGSRVDGMPDEPDERREVEGAEASTGDDRPAVPAGAGGAAAGQDAAGGESGTDGDAPGDRRSAGAGVGETPDVPGAGNARGRAAARRRPRASPTAPARRERRRWPAPASASATSASTRSSPASSHSSTS